MMSTRDRKLALAVGLASGILGLGAAAAGAETDPAVEASSRGSKSAPPVVESTTTTVTLPPETTTTVTSAPAVAQESPPPVEAPPVVEQQGQERAPAVVEPVPAPRPAPAPSRPLPVLARTGNGGQALSILAGSALALGGAAIVGSAGARRRRS
jgi:hypothetical protein